MAEASAQCKAAINDSRYGHFRVIPTKKYFFAEVLIKFLTNPLNEGIIILAFHADMAQLAAQLICNQ